MMQNKKFVYILIGLLLVFAETAAQKNAYNLFNDKGRETRYERMVKTCMKADVILFGELHNNPISHWMQYELTKDLLADERINLVLGAEMFETDGQLILDEYFSGIITREKFEDEMRLWNNYGTDYKPLVEIAKDSGLKFIATNIPRRYANVVYKLGLDTLNSLSDLAKSYMMPLPLIYDTSLPGYSNLEGGEMMDHGSPNFRDSQAIKDATMAYFILKNLQRGETFLHFNGVYHSNNYEGIGYFLKKLAPDLQVITISTVSQKDVSKLEEENEEKADFMIAVPESMTKTN
ncbi:MAG: ChaN family lipoprotein [Bacteroidales bacterium]